MTPSQGRAAELAAHQAAPDDAEFHCLHGGIIPFSFVPCQAFAIDAKPGILLHSTTEHRVT
jgi:hypothetical protein